MSEKSEIAKDVVKQLLSSIDALAAKLGIAAEHIWKFTVVTMAVNARRNLAKSCAIAILPIILFGWSVHVLRMPIPRESVTIHGGYITGYLLCTVTRRGPIETGNCQVQAETNASPQTKGDISEEGQILIASGVITATLGFIFLFFAVEGIINAIAATKTVEYDAFHDLLDTLLDR